MEKDLRVKHQKIIGSPVSPPGSFCGIGVFDKVDEKSRRHRGQLFALLSIVGPKSLDAPLASKIIFDLLEEEYFRETEGSPLVALEKATVSAGHRFIDLALGGAGGAGSAEFDLVLAVSWGQVLYLSKIGGGGVYLLRENSLKEVLLGGETQVTTASGLINGGDVLILSTAGFRRTFTTEQLLDILPKIEEEIARLTDKTSVAALILKFDVEESPSRQEIIRFAQPRKVPGGRLWPRLLTKLVSLISFPKTTPIFLRRKPNSSRVSRGFGLKLVLLLLFLAFLSSVVLTLKKQSRRSLDLESQKLLTQAQTNITSAADLVDLNNARAQLLLEKALEGLDRVDRFGYSLGNTQDLRDQARQLLVRVTKETGVAPKLLYDFSLQDRNSQPSVLTIAAAPAEGSRDLFVADRGSHHIFRVNLTSGEASISKLDDGSLKSPIFLSAADEALLGSSEKGEIFSIALKDGTVAGSLLGTTDFAGMVDLKTYLGNLYLLMPSENQILKSLVLEGGRYAKPQSWLKEDRDFSQVSGFAIDGSIYLLKKTGEVLKFETGEGVDFRLTGFSGVISASANLFTDPLTAQLYLLDAASNKLLVFSKEGVYQKQYTLAELKLDSSRPPLFVVDDAVSKAYFLSQTQLFQFDLKE